MIERAFIHVAGPDGAGKTTFVETVLRGVDRWWLAARCVRNDSLRQSRETSAKAHPELRPYRVAGATAAALFEFPGDDIGSDEFFMTHLMEDYSEGVVIEGDNLRPADVGHVAGLDRTHLCWSQCHDGHRLTRKSHELDLVASPSGMSVNNRSDIAGFELCIVDILGQDDAVVLMDHHGGPGQTRRRRSRTY